MCNKGMCSKKIDGLESKVKNMDSSEGYGLKNEGIDFASNILLKNIREEVSRLSDLHRNFKKIKVTVFEGLGRFKLKMN